MGPNPAAARKGELSSQARQGTFWQARYRKGVNVEFKSRLKSPRARNRKKQKRQGSPKKSACFHADGYVTFR